jgi:hypothetical protein
LKIGTTSKVLVVLLAATASAAGAAFLRADPPAFGAGQILARLPGGSSIHSLLRADMDGRGPGEIAAVARVPAFPGAQQTIYTALIFRYDRLRREHVEVYRAPSPGRVPFSVNAAAGRQRRDVVIFAGLNDDGTQAVRAVTLAGGKGRPLPEKEARSVVAGLSPALPAVTWRYAIRNGTVVSRAPVVRIRARQTLRVQSSGGGPVSVVLPDPRLDVTESGFRARTPGNYRIRIVTGVVPVEQAYVLTVIVEPPPQSFGP